MRKVVVVVMADEGWGVVHRQLANEPVASEKGSSDRLAQAPLLALQQQNARRDYGTRQKQALVSALALVAVHYVHNSIALSIAWSAPYRLSHTVPHTNAAPNQSRKQCHIAHLA